MKQFFRMVQMTAVVAVAALLWSCAAVNSGDATAEAEANCSPRFIQRAEEFRQAVAGCPDVGFSLSEKTLDESWHHPAQLAARCSLLGMTEVYCRVNPDQLGGFFSSYSDHLRGVVAEMHRYRIRCYAEIDGTELFAMIKRSGEHAPYNQIKEMVRSVYAFNRNGKSGQQFDGVITILLPHRADDFFARRHPSMIYHWTAHGYGIGAENDLIHREAMQMMIDVKETALNLPVGQHTGHFYHDRTVNRELSVGSINHYLDVAAFVLVENPGADRLDIIANAGAEISSARRPRSVMVNLMTGGDPYSDRSRQDSLQARSWPEIIATLGYVTKEFEKYQTFRGLAFSDYESFEEILAPGQ